MSTTRVLVYGDTDDADSAVGNWGDDYKIIRIGPTDRVEFKQNAADSIVWKSGSDADWTIVIATKDSIVTDGDE